MNNKPKEIFQIIDKKSKHENIQLLLFRNINQIADLKKNIIHVEWL
jgi:hypothetical protein